MQKKLLLSLAVLALSSSIIYSQEEQEPLKLKGVEVQNDYHEKITWVKSKPIALVQKDFIVSAYSVSYIQLYFGLYMEDSIQRITPVHFVNRYKGSRWVFFDEISYLLGSRKEVREGRGINYKMFDSDTKTKVSNGVSEKSDITLNSVAKEFIKYIIEKPVTRLEIRYRNKKEREIKDLQVYGGTKLLKKHFTTFITAYNQVVNKFSLGEEF